MGKMNDDKKALAKASAFFRKQNLPEKLPGKILSGSAFAYSFSVSVAAGGGIGGKRMFIVTAKLTKARAAAICAGVIALVVLIVLLASGRDAKTADPAAAQAQKDISFKNIRDNEARIGFLGAFGWETGPQPASIEEVVIPETFGEVYAQYNELQKAQGLDLAKYAGKTVRRYTYEVLNYPGAEDTVYADLLIYKNRVIGADVCSAKLAGFMHGLIAP